MYANNLFTLNNVPTLSVSAAFGGNSSYADNGFPISCSDVLFASAVQFGRVVLERSFSGFGSVGALLAEISRSLDSTSGLVTLHLRNSTCGWSMKRTVCVKRRAVSMFAAFA